MPSTVLSVFHGASHLTLHTTQGRAVCPSVSQLMEGSGPETELLNSKLFPSQPRDRDVPLCTLRTSPLQEDPWPVTLSTSSAQLSSESSIFEAGDMCSGPAYHSSREPQPVSVKTGHLSGQTVSLQQIRLKSPEHQHRTGPEQDSMSCQPSGQEQGWVMRVSRGPGQG